MKRRVTVTAAVLAIVMVSGAAYYRTTAAAEPQLVFAVVTRGSVVETVDATGALEAVTTVQVGTQVSGTIKALYADYNSQVRKGQVIAQLEPSLFQTQVDQARATLARLQSEVDRAGVQLEDSEHKLRRARELAAAALIASVDLETAEANARQAAASLQAARAQVLQARASLNQTQVNLGHATITAPIDGVVISRSVDVGQTVAASMQAPTLFVLANDLTNMQVNASVAEADVGRIDNGQAVTFRVDAFPDDVFTGTVEQVRLEPVVEQNVVSYVTVIAVPNPELKLRPGMTATVSIEVAREDDVLRVPATALRFRPTAEVLAARGEQSSSGPTGRRVDSQGVGGISNQVWVLENERLQPISVRTSISDGRTMAIVGGDLRPGAQVVTGMAAADAGRPVGSATTTSPLLPRRPGSARNQGSRR
jgi:HlyD family secretion protein